MTDDAELQPAVAAQFEALAELLSAAPDAVWDTGSLCDGWRVREVVAHMTMPARYSDDQFMAELERCGYDFTRLSNEIASRDAAVPSAQLVSDLRSDVLGHWSPPGGGFHGALIHVVIHGLDVTVPLREARLTPDEILRVVLDDLTKGELTNTSTSTFPVGSSRPTISTGHTVRVRPFGGQPKTWPSQCAAGGFRVDGSRVRPF